MAEQIYNVKCGFFDAVNNDRVYTAEDMNRLYKRVIHDGVFPDENNNPSDDLLVEADSGMTITVNPGEGVFANRWFKNTIEIPIEVPTNSANDRIDSVIVQVDTRKSGRAGNIVYRTGEPSSNPTPPAINQLSNVTEYRLANITVASGATAITNADITDLRGTSECPWVTGIVSANDIPPNSVTEAQLATDAVTNNKIAGRTIAGGKLKLHTVTTNEIALNTISANNLDVFLQSFVNSGYVLRNATVSTIAQLESLIYHINPCIYNLVLTGNCATAFGVASGTRALMFTLGDWNVSVTRFLAIIGKQSEWTQVITISGSSYSYGDWIESSKGLTTSDLPPDFMNEFYSKIGYEEISIDDIAEINSANFASPFIKYGLKLTGTAASSFGVDDNTIAELTTAEADGEIKRYITFPEIEGVKWAQTVNSVAPSWSAGSWNKLGGNQVIKGKYSIGFNSDGSIRATANVTGLNLSLGGSTSVYVASQVTQITENFGRSGINPDLTYLYVDNEQGVVDIHSSILNDSNITIYYKSEFSIIDLIIETLMATVSVISQVNTQLENAINGVSE